MTDRTLFGDPPGVDLDAETRHLPDPLSASENRQSDDRQVSADARDSVDAAAMRVRILSLIHDAGVRGLTSDDVEELTGWTHQSVSPRFTELKAGYRPAIVPNGMVRSTRSGRGARCWVVNTDIQA